MATIIRTDGSKEKYSPVGDYITIAEISMLINGMVEPIFIGEFWFFLCKNALRLKRDMNPIASEILGMEVWGDAVIASDDELSPTFFFPKELVKEIKAMGAHISKKIINENPALAEDAVPEEQKEAAKEIMMRSGYKKLLKSDKDFNSVMKNFEIYNDGKQIINIPPVKEERYKAVDILINYFSDKEEYEKCSELVNFKKEMDKFYKEF